MNFINAFITHYQLLITHIKIGNCPSLDSSGYPTAGMEGRALSPGKLWSEE
jgi:hypothetical protein